MATSGQHALTVACMQGHGSLFVLLRPEVPEGYADGLIYRQFPQPTVGLRS